MTKQRTLSEVNNSQKRASQGGVQSVSRALDLLEAFPVLGPELGLTAIAAHLKMNKATAYRLLATLEERGYVERSPESRKYRLGVRTFELGAYFQSQLDIRRLALPFLTSMVAKTNEAAFLCVREGDEALCIERVESEQEVNIFTLRVGGRQPLHCGAAPRALLAGLDDAELAAYAQRTGLPSLTENTISSLAELRRDVHQTRAQGYVVSNEDVTLGIMAVGAPIYNHAGEVTAAISLSGLAARYGPARVAELAAIIVANARQLSRQFGYQNEPQPLIPT